jgi:putative membrane protein
VIDYDPHSWLRHFFDVKGSMVREILGRVLLCVLASLAVAYVHFNHHALDVSDKAHALIGIALGLLLVFRTNASYDRFWEGRKMWGAIVNESRNIARVAAVHLRDEPALARRILAWTIAYAWSTRDALRGKKGVGEAGPLLDSEEAAAVASAQHVPTAISIKISELVKVARERGRLSDYMTVYLDQNVQLLIDYMGACERIMKTPLPFAYVVHLRRALIAYCLTLPFALVGTFGWLSIPVVLLVSYTMFGIEEIGVEIEDPFGMDDNDLPLERICGTIERDLRAVMDRLGGPTR